MTRSRLTTIRARRELARAAKRYRARKHGDVNTAWLRLRDAMTATLRAETREAAGKVA